MLKKAPIKLPEAPGCYIFRGPDKKPVYVGKAKNLRSRVSSYFLKHVSEKVRKLRAEAVDLDFVVTGSEWEAFLLENNFIKQFHPRFNVLLRDDKTYPFIRIDLKKPFPKAEFTRRMVKDGARYFGPFVPSSYARKNLKAIQEFFMVATCRDPLDGSRPRPCLLFEMGKCLAPCVTGKVKKEEYRKRMEEVVLFLEGKNKELLDLVDKRMKESAAAQEYETAAHYRDLLAAAQSLELSQSIVTNASGHADYYALYGEGERYVIEAFIVLDGKVVDRTKRRFDRVELSREELFETVLTQIYSNSEFIPDALYISEKIGGQSLVSQFLSEKKGKKVEVFSPKSGKNGELLKTLLRNAEMEFRLNLRESQKLAPLQKLLSLKKEIRRIEAFDVSHFQKEAAYVSMVAWQEGRLVKTDYRKFKLKEAESGDDYGALKEAVSRRYKRLLVEGGAFPDLLLIDGGPNQGQSALEGLKLAGAPDIPVVALAKKEEQLFLPRGKEPLPLAKDSPSMLIVRSIRDEAHRTAISANRRQINKNRFTSPLLKVKGLGEKSVKKLIKRYLTTENVMNAPAGELEKIVGKRVAARIMEWKKERAKNEREI
ncbi:MAG TPA: excinuclease ABC subunit UvrC [Acidobacteriota bacterium]|nr:excinuclease ABC subunit UvrC [Acidobacteriota bacterium]HQO20361.1 excinuclease ABC subunit UvrC [Acidobacteriota bacterium]HQQ47005.1 excinuclease ABC subunit UvrC [Acidobacteriota bacterium]